jgi:hypothetical protein
VCVRIGRFLGVLVCVGAAALAAGCGTEDVGAGGAQPVSLAAAVSRTQDQTARVAISIATQIQSMSVSYTETGEFDFAHGRGTISMQGPLSSTEVFLPPTTYVKMPSALISTGSGSGSMLPKGKTWIAVPDSGAGDPAASLLGSPEDGADPAGLLAALTAESSSVQKLGPSAVRGVPVTGYALTIDSAKAAALPGADRADVESLLKSFDVPQFPVEVWVDGQNLVRREQLTLALSGGLGAPAGSKLTLTTDFYDFGVPVHISAPPAAEVVQESQAPKIFGSSVSSSSGSGSGSSGTPIPPTPSGTLAPGEAAAAEQAVSAFWAALGGNNTAAVAATVLPSQRTCVQSDLGSASGAPAIRVSGLHISAAEAAGDAGATVLFTVKATATMDGQSIPVLPGGAGTTQWLTTTELSGHWYVNLQNSTSLAFGGSCS